MSPHLFFFAFFWTILPLRQMSRSSSFPPPQRNIDRLPFFFLCIGLTPFTIFFRAFCSFGGSRPSKILRSLIPHFSYSSPLRPHTIGFPPFPPHRQRHPITWFVLFLFWSSLPPSKTGASFLLRIPFFHFFSKRVFWFFPISGHSLTLKMVVTPC